MTAPLTERSGRAADRRRGLAIECAARLVDVAPLVVRRVRARMRRQIPDLTMPQYRSLVYIEIHDGCALRALAEHLGITPATSSSLVDRLVRRGWVTRATDAENRRRVRLALTARGKALLAAARAAVRREIAQAIAGAPMPALLAARRGLDALRGRLQPAQAKTGELR